MPHLSTLLLQIGVILVTARSVGWLFRKLYQPQVMGEMVAGILLGPSLLGWLAPDAAAALFPAESLGYLNALSQIGVLLFMFMVGIELEPRLLRGRKRTALVTSQAGTFAPFVLGALLALLLYSRLSDAGVSPAHFALFVGTAMSITAFPVLARILSERNMLRSQVGTVAIASAAIGDVIGWGLLAGIVALVRASDAARPLWITALGSMAFVSLMVFVVRGYLRWIEEVYCRRGELSHDVLALILLLVFASAWITDWLGIHALFGAFLVGAVMPKEHDLVKLLAHKLESVTVVLLLPLFFAFTGLRTRIGLVSGAEMWLYCGLIIAVAILGKFGGVTLATRWSGMPWREAGAVGILMNTRGLMELVLLNIGLDIGVISPTVFAMMVLMALATTFMTAPMLEWVYFARLLPPARDEQIGQADLAVQQEEYSNV